MDFIIVPRKLFDPDVFGNEPYSKREAFLDLVQMAAYETTDVFVAGHKYVAERGQVIVSKSFLAKRWRWNIDKVRRYIQYLERNHMCNHMCDHQCNQPITSISIVSYDSYQGGATTPATTCATTPATTPATQEKEIINNKQEIKKDIYVNKELADAVERIYKLYPSSVVRNDGNRVSLRSTKDKDKIQRLLKSRSEEELTSIIKQYLGENPGAYTKMFSTFLNNLPDYGEQIFQPQPADWLVEGESYYASAFIGHEEVLNSLGFELVRHVKRNNGALVWKNGKFIIAK